MRQRNFLSYLLHIGNPEMKDKIALVTGSSSGIGREVAKALAAQGARVAVVASRDLQKAQAVVDEIAAAGGVARAFVADIAAAHGATALVRQVEAEMGPIELLVNSAGVYFPTRAGEATEEQFDRMVAINLKGSFFTLNAVAPGMKARGAGRIVNIASVAGIAPNPEYSLYAATKAGIIALTRAAALELAPYGINVNAIAPGNTETPINADIRTAPEFAAQRARIAAVTPSRRLFTPPDEIAAAIVFLLSDAARGMYGSVMVIDEGKSVGMPLRKEGAAD
ncbi:SDR family NAD(P)-dependent oxidoreductase [Burkholderia dolosa]|jgi:3-oxoacyl-[acyl-carrier protein] reductase|uniref:SDR family NAD(P)-dependent oxidoreductase n=1 Tax=Burkholderia dolosa TaxID=152500 RepID=UPI0027D3398C|nr:SDR family NAD(P)-dependent oxidoreductase [Burkholderia dolosa]